MFDPLNILGQSCICPFALSVRSPDFTNFSPCVVCRLSYVLCPRPHHLVRDAFYRTCGAEKAQSLRLQTFREYVRC